MSTGMNSILINTFENLLGAGLIVSALVVTAGIGESTDGRDAAHGQEKESISRTVRIEDRLWALYAFDSDLGPFNLEIDVRGDTVVIDGVVNGVELKNLAGNIAIGMDGIDHVENRILVVEAMSAVAG